MTGILGSSAFYHDAAAALVVDGEVVAAAQEECFSRRKYDERFPARAIAYCLEEADLRAEQLDFVGFYDKPFLKLERPLETYLSFALAGFRSSTKALPIWLNTELHVSRESASHTRLVAGSLRRRRRCASSSDAGSNGMHQG